MPDHVRRTELGRYLRMLRMRANLRQEGVATAIGITREFLSYIESGKYLPPKKHLKKLAELYGIPDRDLRVAVVKYKMRLLKREYGFK